MRIRTVSPIWLAVVTALVPQLAFAESPTAPGDLRADVYSASAGEIFWSRSTDSNGVVVAYEVLQDGNLVTSRDALSFFADTLTDGVTSTFSVIAVDNDGERSETVSIDVTGGVSGNNADTSDRPLPPANLFATVYSATAAEVFWDRNNDQALTYEVSIDGAVVANVGGTSFFSGDLSGGRIINVDIVAIDVNGQRSGAASVQFNPTGGSGGNNPPVASAIDAPANLRLDVYSVTAGELFWDRYSQTDLIEITEVRRDGELLTATDGTSFFDGSRVPGVAYTYEVTFIGANGDLSDAAIVDEAGGVIDPGDGDSLSIDDIVIANNVITVPDDGDIYQVQDSISLEPFCEGLVDCPVVPGSYNVINLSSGDRLEGVVVSGDGVGDPIDPNLPVINSVTFEDTLREIIAVINAEQLDVITERVNPVYSPDINSPPPPDGVTFVSIVENPNTLGDFITFDCSNGGTYLFDEDISALGGGVITLDDCFLDGSTYNGQYSRGFIRPTVVFNSYRSFEAIEIDGSNTTLDGRYTIFITGGRNVRALQFFDINFSSSTTETVISDYSSEVSINTNGPVRTIEANFTVSSPFSRNEAITVTTDQLFSTTGGSVPFYETGMMTAVAADGSEFTINADTGDIETFQVTINELGAVTSRTLSWSDGFQLRCVNSVRNTNQIPECI